MTVVFDYGFSDAIPVGTAVAIGTSGLSINNDLGLVSRITDASAPASPSFVGQWSYPVGFPGGVDPGTVYNAPIYPPGVNELYTAWYIKVSNPWQDHPNGNKMMFQFAGGGGAGGQVFIIIAGPISAAPLHTVYTTTEFSSEPATARAPNVNSTVFTYGVWHLVEWYMNKTTHVMRWWLDGVLQGDYANVIYPPNNWDEVHLAPTWGGTGSTKTEQDYFWYDHLRISRR